MSHLYETPRRVDPWMQWLERVILGAALRVPSICN